MKEPAGRPVTTASSKQPHTYQVPGDTLRPNPGKSPQKRGVKVQTTKQAKPATPHGFPPELVGPSPIVPIQVEGIYTKALLDTGAQVTLLYSD